MRKKITAVLAGVLASAMVLAGCQASKGLETEAVKITQYKDLEVDKVEKTDEISDEQVEMQIQSALKSNAEVEKVKDRAVENGDTANIDYVGKIDGKEFDGGSAQGYPLEIGSGAFIPGFEDSIIGHEIGDEFDWEGKFPDSYQNTEYAGKDVVFTIKVNSISKSVVPELSDEFVKSVSKKSETVDEYKEEIKKKLEKDAENEYKNQLSTAVMKKVLENTEVIKYPEDEVKELKDETIKQMKSFAEYQNIKFEDYLEQNNMTEEQFEKQIEDAAKDRVKQELVFNAIADAEKIELTDELYEEQLEVMASTNGYQDVETLKKEAEEEDLKEAALYNLVLEWLSEHCIQKA